MDIGFRRGPYFKKFGKGCIVLAGDLNVPLELKLDTSLGKSSLSHTRLTFLRKRLHDTQLMDTWRIMHPSEREFFLFTKTPNLFQDQFDLH